MIIDDFTKNSASIEWSGSRAKAAQFVIEMVYANCYDCYNCLDCYNCRDCHNI